MGEARGRADRQPRRAGFWRRFARNRLAVLGLIVFLGIVVAGVAAPVLAPYTYYDQDLGNRLAPPGPDHWLGTDGFGRDVLSRLIWGARASLAVGLTAAGLSLLIGLVLGSAAGYAGGRVDLWISRFVDIFMAIPPLFLVLIIVALFGASLVNTMLVIGAVYWPSTARLVRAEFLSLREREFVDAARALGTGSLRIVIRHLLPNVIPSMIVQSTLLVAEAILIESGLSYLGLGAQPPLPSWGNMLAEGRRFLNLAWWIATFPGLAIFATVISLNIVGDGLRDALDPRFRARST